jgi:hypothetical protein
MEQTRKVERSDIWEQIYNVVKKIPREDVEGDAADAPSVSTELEDLFLRLIPEQSLNYKKKLLRNFSSYVLTEWNGSDVEDDIIDEYLQNE